MAGKNRHRTRKRAIIILSIALILLLALAAFFGRSPEAGTEPGEAAHTEQSQTKRLVLDAAKSVIKELKLVLADIEENDLDSARSRVTSISNTINAVRTPVNHAASIFGTGTGVGGKLGTVQRLLNTADMALAEILLPAIDLLEEHPLSGLKAGDGFDTKLIGRYIDFAESVMPEIEAVMECANSVDLSSMDSDGEISGYLELANKLMEIYRAEPSFFPLIKSMIGAEEDRVYVVAVQNPVEIRASGGFPGSVGVMRIQDGILTLGDFKSVTYMLSYSTPKDIQITREEILMFGSFAYLRGIRTPNDADLCPDFERVGHIWASAYEEMNKEQVSGVIAVTPHIVQRLLAATGEEIELFDGLVMNGDNAMEVLLHDIYYKYFTVDYVAGREQISDDLFADAAEKTMKLLTDNVSASQLLDYIPVVQESIADRTLMMWMKDGKEQAFITGMGWNGGLNTDPENPAAGVYFNCVLPSKMGWYFLMDTSIGERVKNEDGSYTYPITVTFTNIATEEDVKNVTTYVSGGMGGTILGAAYFFAPAGGTVSDFAASNGQNISLRTYHELELGFMNTFRLRPNEPITVTYQVTTAPGVETPLVFSKTPTAQ